MKVVCGDPDCREEFFVESKDPVWICTSCEREIVNRNYPFLTAKLMQAKIDGDNADWKKQLSELLSSAKEEIGARMAGKKERPDLAFMMETEAALCSGAERTNGEWRKMHDDLLSRAREVVLSLEKEG